MNRLKKVGVVVAIIIINILVFGIIPLNVLVIWKDFPQWIMIIASAADIAVVLLMARKAFSRKVANIIAVIISSVFAVTCVLLAYACPYWKAEK